MLPGVNPRQMQKMMKQMGIQQVDVEASRVIIEGPDTTYVINNPQVSKVNMMGQMTWQVVGEATEQAVSTTPEISEEDVQTVVAQTGVSEELARETIEKVDGDLAEAIMKLQN